MDMRVAPPKRNSENKKFQKPQRLRRKITVLRFRDINNGVNNTPNLGENMNKTMAALNTVSLITLAGAGLAASYGPDGDKQFSEFSELDLNGDNQISKDEMTLPAKTRFDRADQNRDRCYPPKK